jgi:phenylacetate-CoA ligase
MYLIHGQHLADLTLEQALQRLTAGLAHTLSQPCRLDSVLACAGRFAEKLLDQSFLAELDAASREELRAFCQADVLRAKLEHELGDNPFSLRRIDYQAAHFESWRPLGVVVHITPANAPLLPFFAVLESLLVGNINWLRPSEREQGLNTRLLQALLECDESGQLASHVAVLPVAKAELPKLLAHADGVSAWGANETLKAIRDQLPDGCRWIPWGHKISFAWLVPDAVNGPALDALVDEVCRLDQQACSSPQVVFVDSDDTATLHAIGEQLAMALPRRQACWPALRPNLQEAAQITTTLALAELDQAFSDRPGQVWRGDGWQIVLEHRMTLEPSPLFRTLLLRPLPRHALIQALRSWRTRLQSCGLICSAQEFAGLSQLLLAAGVDRVTAMAQMQAGYSGEPHDGVYALSMLARRVSVSLAADCLAGQATLDPLGPAPMSAIGLPIMDRRAFLEDSMSECAQVFFRSGGSSGAPKLAGFTYRDYHRQMQAAADGLFAAGLDPATDNVLNLMYGGNLYGGLLSFFTVLDKLGARHYPMGGPQDDDYSEIARFIVSQGVDTLIGMPTTVHQLFLREARTLRAYGGIRKVLLGGEHLGAAQRTFIQGFGVQTIRSVLYGSVDAGPLGYSCAASPDGVFHLMSDIQWLEIVDLERDEPAAAGEVGRLLITSLAREGQHLARYDIGDTGRWVSGRCACGSPAPRFELLGRHGGLVRIGSLFIQPQRLAELAEAPLQLHLEHDPDNGTERIRLWVDADPEIVKAKVCRDTELNMALELGVLDLQVSQLAQQHFERHPQSGKTPLWLDKRL